MLRSFDVHSGAHQLNDPRTVCGITDDCRYDFSSTACLQLAELVADDTCLSACRSSNVFFTKSLLLLQLLSDSHEARVIYLTPIRKTTAERIFDNFDCKIFGEPVHTLTENGSFMRNLTG